MKIDANYAKQMQIWTLEGPRRKFGQGSNLRRESGSSKTLDANLANLRRKFSFKILPDANLANVEDLDANFHP